jgi:hypothetical protein
LRRRGDFGCGCARDGARTHARLTCVCVCCGVGGAGNKFEFRAVGASMTPHRSNYVLNTILAESLAHISALLTKKTGGAPASGAVLNDVIRGVLKVRRAACVGVGACMRVSE